MTITNGYCTLAEVKAALRLTDGEDDALLENAIEGASRRIDGYCGRWFYKTTATAIPVQARSDYFVYPANDIANSTSIIVKTDDNGDGTFEDTWVLNTDYQLEPTNAPLLGRPYRKIVAIGAKTFPSLTQPGRFLVQVTAEWGWDAVPHDVREACVLLSMRGFARYNSALGVVGFADMAIQVRAVDPDVRDLLNPYRLVAVS